jgi:hypothetical protein
VAGTCGVDGCIKLAKNSGMCWGHYCRVRRHGSTEIGIKRIPGLKYERMLAGYPDKPTDGCWEWTGNRTGDGYGRLAGRQGLAHRLSYEYHLGPIPDGLEIDHLCRNRGCGNPAHMEAVTHRVNCQRREVRHR